MAFSRLCSLSDLARGEMREFEIDGHAILLVWPEAGELRAFQALCLHEGIPLADGFLDGGELICAAHNWTFDASTGENKMPGSGCLAVYPLEIEGGEVRVDVAAMVPGRKEF